MEATMETTNQVSYTHNKDEFIAKIDETMEKILQWISRNDYQFDGEMPTKAQIEAKFKHLSWNQTKKIQKYCHIIDRKITFKRVNGFFGIIARTFEVKRAKVKVSVKEEKIQKARRAWLKSRDESEKLLAKYKKEKGDFYKGRKN